MNNGKVRIYELSKELNLDNRDILAVCDQLNIAVKSHSSTISEAEAEQIRSAAQKFVAARAASASANRTASKKPAQAPVKKQQILAVHRSSPTLVEPPRRPDAQAAAAKPTSPAEVVAQGQSAAAPPKPPTLPSTSLQPPARLGQPAVDAGVNVTAAEASVIEDLVAEEANPLVESLVEPSPNSLADSSIDSLAEPPTEALAEPLIFEELPVPEEMTKPVFAEAPAKSEVSELVAPPPRPTAPAGVATLSKPTLKRASDGTQTAAAKDAPQVVSVTAKEGKTEGKGEGRSPREGRNGGDRPPRDANRERNGARDGAREGRPKGTGAPSLKPKPVIELRSKPIRPGEAAAADGDGKTGEAKKGSGKVITVGVAPADAVPELKRPTPPRPPKRGKDWEEEEEEVAQKKVGTKTKRRSPNEDEDIEDLDVLEELEDLDLDEEEEEEEESTVTQVSLSLLRPPKPKSNKPAAQAIKSSAPPRRKSGESRFRRDRRQEETRQRPEIVQLSGSISLHDLAEQLVAPETELIRVLFMKGIAANINQILDIPTASMVAEELGVLVDTVEAQAEAKKVTEMIDATDLEYLQRRSPIVTVMGHVDHGKTTLLDSIRKTKVAASEAGGITQHIGAYHVDVEHGGNLQQVVFLDTPGHEAFTAMRARGARVTDIAILVVAADDGVRPQTIEAISHAKAAGVPIVVAINKVDKEEAQPDRVKQELTEFGLVAEEWGGDTIMVPVSAIKGENLDTLLEMLLLVAEVEDLYANPDRPAKGTVVEANLDKSRGPVASLIVQNGTLHVGDILVAGSVFGKVRAMIDDRGHRVEEAGPSFAVQVLGLNGVPDAGDEFDVYKDEKEARNMAESRFDQQRQSRLQQAMASRRVSLGTLSAQAQEGELKELNLIVKADVQGSVEAILGSLQQLPQKEVQVRVLLSSPGEITETDVDLAAASSAVIIGFNTTYASGARQAADREGVDVREYNIIYKLLEDIQGAMEGLLEPELVEEPLGQVEVRAVFPVGKGAVAGCYVKEGKVIRNSKIRVLRKGAVIFEGNLDSLKRMKEDAKEVNAGYECGIGVDNFRDWQEGDIISSFRLVTKRRTLSA